MQLHRPFRFGVVTHNTNASLDALVARAHLAERLGYSAFLIPDHLGDQFDTPLALALVAQSTSTLRIGSFVFANDFRHPALLAKTAATLDVISGGRFELGLGAGWMQSEYEQVGLAFATPRVRIDRLVEALQVIKGLLSGDPVTFAGIHYQITNMRGHPSPVQRPRPPILLGGSGKRILSVAAREADIVGIIPRGMVEPGSLQRIDLADMGSTSVARKVTWIREAAAERFQHLELNLFIKDMALTGPRGDGADQLAHRFALSREQVREIPICWRELSTKSVSSCERPARNTAYHTWLCSTSTWSSSPRLSRIWQINSQGPIVLGYSSWQACFTKTARLR